MGLSHDNKLKRLQPSSQGFRSELRESVSIEIRAGVERQLLLKQSVRVQLPGKAGLGEEEEVTDSSEVPTGGQSRRPAQ